MLVTLGFIIVVLLSLISRAGALPTALVLRSATRLLGVIVVVLRRVPSSTFVYMSLFIAAAIPPMVLSTI